MRAKTQRKPPPPPTTRRTSTGTNGAARRPATTRPTATTFRPSGRSARSTRRPASGIPTGSKNIKWVAQLGSQSYGNPVVADGHVYIGTNNGGGWLKRYPGDKVDLGVLLCFDVKDGKFLWQH